MSEPTLYREATKAEINTIPDALPHPVEWVAVVQVEPSYYEVESDGTAISGPPFNPQKERPDKPVYGWGPEVRKRYAVYRMRITDGEDGDDE